LLGSSVDASSLSPEADTSVLAGVAAVAANHAFPPMPATVPPLLPVRFDVIVTTIPPDAGQHAVVVDQIAVPEWPLTRPAALALGSQPVLGSTGGLAGASRPSDSATFQFVVDESGKPIIATAVTIGRASLVADLAHAGFVARIARLLPDFRFDPALVGACPVRQLTKQLFSD
jgi:hypothetical protein